MDLYLRKVTHPQARDNYCVILKDDGLGVEIGPIGIQQGTGATDASAWGIDTVILMRVADTQGTGKDRKNSMKQFRAAWDRFSSDPARLAEFLQAKR
jgi:hypothetical protein